MAEIEDRLKWLQGLVVNQWKTGKAAELRLYCENGHLKVCVSADLGVQVGPSTSSWKAETVGSSWEAGGRGSPSRLRRRQRRAAERVAEVAAAKHAYTEKAAAEDAEKAAKEITVEKDAADASRNDGAERVAAEKAASVKAAPEKVTAAIAAAKEVSEDNAAKMKADEHIVQYI